MRTEENFRPRVDIETSHPQFFHEYSWQRVLQHYPGNRNLGVRTGCSHRSADRVYSSYLGFPGDPGKRGPGCVARPAGFLRSPGPGRRSPISSRYGRTGRHAGTYSVGVDANANIDSHRQRLHDAGQLAGNLYFRTSRLAPQKRNHPPSSGRMIAGPGPRRGHDHIATMFFLQ